MIRIILNLFLTVHVSSKLDIEALIRARMKELRMEAKDCKKKTTCSQFEEVWSEEICRCRKPKKC